MTSLNSRLQLALLNRKKGRNALEKGFTLVELLIVIVILGILSAVSIPQFLGMREKASLGASIGEAVGIAKECSAIQIAGGPYTTACPDVTSGTNAYSFTSAAATANSAGVPCGPDTADELANGETCSITVDGTTGSIAFSAS